MTNRGAGRLLLQVVCSVTPKKIHSERMAEMFMCFPFSMHVVKKNLKNYFTSSDPHHDMLGGGCQVRVAI